MKQGLLIFARFPEAGKCKTRLIPELGAEGAAELQARMTRHTLAWAQRLAKAQPVVLTVVFEGGDVSRMTAEFGDAFAYVPQVDGGLGDRLLAAVQESFEAGAERLIVVGTDCPELNEQLVATALARLGEHDVCIAPAEDGGYVLLGISRQSPARMVTLLDALFTQSLGEVHKSCLTRLSNYRRSMRGSVCCQHWLMSMCRQTCRAA